MMNKIIYDTLSMIDEAQLPVSGTVIVMHWILYFQKLKHSLPTHRKPPKLRHMHLIYHVSTISCFQAYLWLCSVFFIFRSRSIRHQDQNPGIQENWRGRDHRAGKICSPLNHKVFHFAVLQLDVSFFTII